VPVRWSVLTAATGSALLALLAAASLAGWPPAAPSAGPSPVTVQGVTEAYREMDLTAAEPGLIDRIYVREGQQVQQGQLLAEIDLRVLQATLEIFRARAHAQARLDAARAELALRQDRLDKLLQLRSQGFAQPAEIERAKTDVVLAETTLRGIQEEKAIAQLEVARIEAQIERNRLRSPVDGVVTRIHKEEREFISPIQSENIVTVVQLNPLRIVFAVPVELAFALHEGDTVPLHFPEVGARAQGTVEFVSPVTDARSGTVRVKVLLDNSGGRLRPGLACEMILAR